MNCEFEPLTIAIRVFAADKQYGDPYSWSATGLRVAHDCLEVIGAMRAPTPSEWRAIYRAAQKAGYSTVQYRRSESDGSWRIRKIRIKQDG